MVKKKTSVVLPGGIAGLVHNLQNGGSAVREERQVQPEEQSIDKVDEMDDGQHQGGQVRSEKPATMTDTVTVADADGEMSEEYHIVKDDTEGSWKLFLDMAEKYKKAGGKLATIYIDPELKNVLDRLKYAGEERLPTAAILSSIVARFIYDHEEQIRKIIFGGKLI